MTATDFQLTIIIPALNEVATLPNLIESLASQQGADALEVIIADGGSQDGTLAACQTVAMTCGITLRSITTQPGRARQMNAASRRAQSAELLFLHADTVIDDPCLISNALTQMQSARTRSGSDCIAGHFGLHFIRTRHVAESGYYFYESKTRLNRLDCINGDQGFLLSQHYFRKLGMFDESLDYMEDARLATQVFKSGQWITLPGHVGTSARRFESEGLRNRQTLNALLCNFEYIGLRGFFGATEHAYQTQNNASRLNLEPFLKTAHRLSWKKGIKQGLRYWLATGDYVAQNAWQLAFALDCRRNRSLGLAPGEGERHALNRYERWLKPIVISKPGQAITATLTCIWFYALLLLYRFKP
ncbi:MAG: glycosyltransferase [Gammaproteobacteria bacterium]|nr:glycosyltransferase [Gammaproteobacteria bacterium]